jgi:hypothetical protein
MESKKTRIMDSLVREFRDNKFRYTDVIRTAYELNYGVGKYTSAERGYYSGAMRSEDVKSWGSIIPKGYLRKPGRDPRYLVKNEDKSYSIISTI